MSEMKPTPGPWEATCSNENGYYPEWFIRVPGEPPVISYEIAKITSYRPDGTDESDARLIAEAGTVFHNTGLSPVQLVEMVKELQSVTRRLMRSFPTDSDMEEAGWEQCEIDEACNAHDAARAALAKCEGVGND